jgi:hypothetical protein
MNGSTVRLPCAVLLALGIIGACSSNSGTTPPAPTGGAGTSTGGRGGSSSGATGGSSGVGGSGPVAGGSGGAGGAGGSGGTGSGGASGSGGSGTMADGGSDTPTGGTAIVTKVIDNQRIQTKSSLPNFQRVEGMVDFSRRPYASVKVVIELGTTCYPFTRWAEDPPPAGHNWPPKCDPFDRLFEVVLNDPGKQPGPPGIELVRAITPFGGPLTFEADITDVANGLGGMHRLSAYIDSWGDPSGKGSGSDAGWTITATVTAVPGAAPREVLAVIPVYHARQEMATVPPSPFTLPEGTKNVRLEYRATGHGGGPVVQPACVGPAEEFCKRTHTITVDGQSASTFDAWRDNCATLCTTMPAMLGTRSITICKENPTGAIASVRAPRANWCPGSVTPAKVIDLPLTPGAHQIGWSFSGFEMGGNWRISVVAIAYK